MFLGGIIHPQSTMDTMDKGMAAKLHLDKRDTCWPEDSKLFPLGSSIDTMSVLLCIKTRAPL